MSLPVVCVGNLFLSYVLRNLYREPVLALRREPVNNLDYAVHPYLYTKDIPRLNKKRINITFKKYVASEIKSDPLSNLRQELSSLYNKIELSLVFCSGEWAAEIVKGVTLISSHLSTNVSALNLDQCK